jgi:hypothetical protein
MIGSLEINLDNWDFYFSVEDQYFVMMHEVAHTRGFSINPGVYNNWVDSNGTPHAVVKMTISVLGTSNDIIFTQNVLAKGRELFGCPTLQGI